MKVRVKSGKTGFYGGQRRHEGEEFEILHERHIGKWMDVIDSPKVDEPKEDKVDYKAEAERLDIPLEVDGKKVHHHTLRKQVETALAQEKGE
jgi:hypothetical protein